MVYKRGKRPSFYFEAKLQNGYKQLCADTSDKRTAQRIEHMWGTLADQRAWDLLQPVVDDLAKPTTQRTHTIGRLLDWWTETKGDVAAIRRKAADVDVVALVESWYDAYKGTVKVDSAEHALAHVRHFFPAGTRRLASSVKPAWLSETLAAYPGKRNTRRKVHSSVSMFLDYLTTVRQLFPANPMNHVERPKPERSPIRFYELDDVEKIVAWQPTEQRRALFALLYGTGMEVSVSIKLMRSDFNPATKEVRSAGTKAATRDRVSRVADWAWPIVWRYMKAMTPHTPLFPGVTRWGVNFWHRQAVSDGQWEAIGRQKGHPLGRGGDAKLVKDALHLPQKFPVMCARDHWAVRALRAGTPVAVVQHQLGHGSPMLTLTKYGRFLPSGVDREKWEAAATEYEAKRREAK